MLVSLLTVVVVVLFLALSSTVVYFVIIRPKRITAITERLDRLSSVRNFTLIKIQRCACLIDILIVCVHTETGIG